MSRRPSAPPPPGPTRWARAAARSRRLIVGVGCVVVLAVAALVAAAIVPGSHATGATNTKGLRSVATSARAPRRRPQETRVLGSSVRASRYAAIATAIENGMNAKGQLVSDLQPLNWRRIQKPIAAFRLYAQRWAVQLGRSLRPLTADLRAGDRRGAERAWVTSFDDYLHLGAVYGLLPARLDDALAEVPSSEGDTRFPGLHRIEKGLWTGQSVRSLVPVALSIERAAVTLRHTIRRMWIGSFAYTLRAHEIMEDAQRDLMTGLTVPWSHAGVSATAASLVAEREVIATLTPLLDGRDDALGTSEYWMGRLTHALAQVRRRDGTYPTLGRLTLRQRELIDGTLAGTCSALSAVPDTLELHPIPNIPRDPAGHR